MYGDGRCSDRPPRGWASWLATRPFSAAPLTVAGQRRTCTGFPRCAPDCRSKPPQCGTHPHRTSEPGTITPGRRLAGDPGVPVGEEAPGDGGGVGGGEQRRVGQRRAERLIPERVVTSVHHP